MPVHIGEFEVSSPAAPAAAPSSQTGGGAEAAAVIVAPAQVQRAEQERRERALRLFAH